MKNKKGKYLKQSRIYKGVYGVIAVLAMLIVFGIIAFVFYRVGERSATTIQGTEPHTTGEPQEIYRKPIETVVHEMDSIIVEPTVTERKETVPATEETTQPTESVPPISEAAEEISRTATVLRSAGELNVRSGAGTSYNEIGRLKGGDTITVYEQINVNGMNWGNIGYGWVSMDYVTFEADDSYVPQYQKSDYFGDWLTDNKMCYMCITQNGNGADIRVVSTIAQGVDMTWSMYGEFDEHGAIRYWNGVRKDHNAGIESVKYTNGEGAIVIDGLSLSWHESAEGPGEAGRFERVYNYQPNNGIDNSSNQGNSAGQGGSNNSTTTDIPRRFDSDDIKQVLTTEVKIELGYRQGDTFSMDHPMVTGYDSSTGKYYTFAQGKWLDTSYFINAVLQDVNGVLTVSRVLNFEVK